MRGFPELMMLYLKMPGMTQAKVARGAGISSAAVSKMANGQQGSTLETATKIASVFKLGKKETKEFVEAAISFKAVKGGEKWFGDSRTEGESSNPGAGFELDRHAEPAPGVPGHEGDLQTPRDSVSPNPRPAPLLDYNHASVRMSASDCDGDGRAPQPEHDTAVHAPSRSLYRLGFEGSSCRRKRGSEKGSDSCGKVGFYRVVQNEEMRWQSR